MKQASSIANCGEIKGEGQPPKDAATCFPWPCSISSVDLPNSGRVSFGAIFVERYWCFWVSAVPVTRSVGCIRESCCIRPCLGGRHYQCQQGEVIKVAHLLFLWNIFHVHCSGASSDPPLTGLLWRHTIKGQTGRQFPRWLWTG